MLKVVKREERKKKKPLLVSRVENTVVLGKREATSSTDRMGWLRTFEGFVEISVVDLCKCECYHLSSLQLPSARPIRLVQTQV